MPLSVYDDAKAITHDALAIMFSCLEKGKVSPVNRKREAQCMISSNDLATFSRGLAHTSVAQSVERRLRYL